MTPTDASAITTTLVLGLTFLAAVLTIAWMAFDWEINRARIRLRQAMSENKWLNRILSTSALMVLAWLAVLVVWALVLFETDQETISDRMRTWGQEAPPIELVALGAYVGAPCGFVLGGLAGHWGWSERT